MSDETRINIIIADDHPLLRTGLRESLERDPGIVILEEAGDGEQALRSIRRHRPDIAVLDIEMPIKSGVEVVEELRRDGDATKIIVLTVHKSKRVFDSLIELGVQGYILKDSSITDIRDGILAVYNGDHFISPVLAAGFFREHTIIDNGKGDQLKRLSGMEARVMLLIAKGHTSREIGEILGISPHTVTRHRENISSKLDLKGSNALLRFALENRSYLLDELG